VQMEGQRHTVILLQAAAAEAAAAAPVAHHVVTSTQSQDTRDDNREPTKPCHDLTVCAVTSILIRHFIFQV